MARFGCAPRPLIGHFRHASAPLFCRPGNCHLVYQNKPTLFPDCHQQPRHRAPLPVSGLLFDLSWRVVPAARGSFPDKGPEPTHRRRDHPSSGHLLPLPQPCSRLTPLLTAHRTFPSSRSLHLLPIYFLASSPFSLPFSFLAAILLSLVLILILFSPRAPASSTLNRSHAESVASPCLLLTT